MPIGPTVNVLSTLIGALIGASIGHYIPSYLRKKMPQIFGLLAFTLGGPLIVGMNHMLSVSLSLLLGTIIGELFKLEDKIKIIAKVCSQPLEKFMTNTELTKTEWMSQFIAVLVLFSTSGLGVIGSMTAGMSGDHSLLLVKSILDFFTAIIFGCSLGYSVALSAISQGIVMFTLFFLGTAILPLTTSDMLSNLSAVGGMIMLATGFQIMRIKEFSVANMLPSLLIVMPLYALLN